tara:strand:- start:2368 stop:3567 length:1200 start_codon:yes stop_codon:yes gene_type:complete
MQKTHSTQPQFIFIVGAPRSSNNTINALLDGHPDVLSWPSECHYFTIFNKVAKNNSKAEVTKLNAELIEHLQDRLSERQDSHTIDKEFKHLNLDSKFGALNLPKFIELINNVSESKTMSNIDYLKFIFECFHQCHAQYQNKEVKYYSIMCTARGFDWYDPKILEGNKLLCPSRSSIGSYGSLRDKYFESVSLNDFFSIYNSKGFLYWLHTYQNISKLTQSHKHKGYLMNIPVADMRANPKPMIQNICEFLSIPFLDVATQMTMLGKPYGGNAREKSLNTGAIASRSSQLKHPLLHYEVSSFKRSMLNNQALPFHHNNKNKLIPALISAFYTSFIQINESEFLDSKISHVRFKYIPWKIKLFIKLLKSIKYVNDPKLLEGFVHTHYLVTDSINQRSTNGK